jgi:hypothetical protein
MLSLGNHVRRVHVPFDHPDVEVVRDPEGNKYRTNMLMLGKKYSIEELFSIMSLLHILHWKETDQSEIFDHWNRLGKQGMSEISMDDASILGLIDVLEWWKNSGWDCKWSEDAMDGASREGHVDVLEWWKNSGLECKWSYDAMDTASQEGHIDVLEWWKNAELQSKIAATSSSSANSLKCEWTEEAMDRASHNGHIEVLEWWKNSGLECQWSADATSQKCHVAVIEWWKKNNEAVINRAIGQQ